MKYIFNISLNNIARMFKDKKIRLYYIYIILLIIISTAILAFQVTDKTYDYNIGDIIESDIRVPRDIHFVKETETELGKKRAAESVSLVFDKDSAVLEESLRQVDFLLNNIIKTLEDNPPIGTDDLTFQLASLKTRTSSAAVCPAIIFSSVVLPVPLMPMMPILSVSFIYKDTLSRRTLPGKLLLILSNDSRIKLHLVLFGRKQYSITHGGM